MPLFGKPNVRKMKEEGDVKGLIKALSYTKDAYTCEFAVDALGQIGDPEAVEPLISALAGKVPDRLNVAVALGQIGDPRAIEPLAATFENWHEIREVTLALGQSGDQRAVEPLVLMMKDFLTSNRQVIAAIAALGKLKNPNALKPLLEIAGNEQPWSQGALESAKMIEPNLDGKNLNLVSCWSTHRTNVYALQSHNWGFQALTGVFTITQTYEHSGSHRGCQACQRLIQKHIDSRLEGSLYNRSMPVGYELGDGTRYSYYPK